MLLTESSLFPPPSVRTIRLSAPSFLNATLSENNIPLYSIETEDATTTIRRCDKSEASAKQQLTDIALVHWSIAESSSDSSPVESPTLASRLIKAGAFALGAECAKDRDVVHIDLDGKRWTIFELLKPSLLGDYRKYSLHGKSFKWKHVNGIWQCFYSSKMIALFEPSITTAPARIRIFHASISITRRVLDMIVLTCMLLVTNPTEWRNPPAYPAHLRQQPSMRQATLQRTATTSVSPAHSRSVSAVQPQVQTRLHTPSNLRRAQSHTNMRMNAPSYESVVSAPTTPTLVPVSPITSTPMSISYSRPSPTRSVPTQSLNIHTPAFIQRSISVRASSQDHHPTRSPTIIHVPHNTRPCILRRASSHHDLHATPLILPDTNASIAQRPSFGIEQTPLQLPRVQLPSSADRLSPDNNITVLSPSSSARLWELPNAYPPLETNLSSPPSMSSSSACENSVPPPPYAPRDPSAPPLTRMSHLRRRQLRIVTDTETNQDLKHAAHSSYSHTLYSL